MPRIVSMIPSATDMIMTLGVEDQLVGRSHSCTGPGSVMQKPVVTRTRIDTSQSSKMIDSQVQSTLQHGQPLYEVDENLLKELAPDVILTQTQCKVCAVYCDDIDFAIRHLNPRPRVVSLDAADIEGIFSDLVKVATAVDAEDRGKALIRSYRNRIARVHHQWQGAEQPRVVCLEWLDPPMIAGMWTPEIISYAGGQDVLGHPGQHGYKTTWETILNADFDVLVLAPCGFDIKRTMKEIDENPPLKKILNRILKKGIRISIVDGDRFINRPGPSVVDSIEILAECFHPDRMEQTQRGTFWVTFEDVLL